MNKTALPTCGLSFSGRWKSLLGQDVSGGVADGPVFTEQSSPWTGSQNAPSPQSPPSPFRGPLGCLALVTMRGGPGSGQSWLSVPQGVARRLLCCLFFSILQHLSLKGCVSNDIKGRLVVAGLWRSVQVSVSAPELPAFTRDLPAHHCFGFNCQNRCLACFPRRSSVPRVSTQAGSLPRPAPVRAREMCISTFTFMCFVLTIGFICLQNLR